MLSDDTTDDTRATDDAGYHARTRDDQTIDVEALAERVYQLMRAEARLGHARGEEPPGMMEE